MTNQSNRYADLFETTVDQMQIVNAQDSSVVYVVSLDEKIGSLKDSSKGHYMVLTDSNNAATVVKLHPQAALQLLSTKSSAQFKVIDKPAPAAEVVATAAPAAAKPQNDAGENTSKRHQAIAFYNAKKAELEANGPIEKVKGRCPLRSAVVKYITETLGGSAALASTYYQNIASGKWS